MDPEYADDELRRLDCDPRYAGSWAAEIVRAYRKRLAIIRAAVDERDFYALKSLHFEKLKGARAHQHSMRINSQWRLIVEFRGTSPNKKVLIVAIEDYH
jgi:toxin HigB-1